MGAALHRRNRKGRAVGLALLLCTASTGRAAVTESSADGFTIVHERTVAAVPAAAWAILIEPRRWWNGAHSYSGDAANITLDARAGGCWCEQWAGGSVEHGRVVFVQPERALRFYAALGPLQALPVAATLTWTLAKAGTGTKLTLTYRVLGRATNGVPELAAPVDQVLGEQADRLAAALSANKSR